LVDEALFVVDMAVLKPDLSSSNSFSFTKTFVIVFWRSSSSTVVSHTVIDLLRLQKFEVPGLPEISQFIPCQCYLKLF
jgi:hypothetical protein